jgi:predicted nucleotidyltransferase
MEKEKLMDEIASILKQQGVEKLILFGSFAWGAPNMDSDIDILAIKNIPIEKTREFRIQLKKALWHGLEGQKRAFDIVVDSEKRIKERIAMGDLFYRDIYTKGRIIYA